MVGGLIINDDILYSKYATEFNRLIDKHNSKHNVRIEHLVGLAHKDGFQLIPAENNFAGGLLTDVTIVDCVITSEGRLQPIFASDGCFERLSIRDNKMSTRSEHNITIYGMLSGEISGNTTVDGDPIEPRLLPLRLGGGRLNIHVISFSEGSSYQYRTIKGVATEVDRRTIPVAKSSYVELLDMDAFNKQYNSERYKGVDRFIKIEQVLRVLHTNGKCFYSKMQKK